MSRYVPGAAAGLAVLLIGCLTARADDRRLAELMPDGTLVYAEMRGPTEQIKLIRDWAITKAALASPGWAEAAKRPDTARLIAALEGLGKALNTDPVSALDGLWGNGIAIGLQNPDGKKQPDSVLLMRGRDNATVRQVLGALLKQIPGLGGVPIPPADNPKILNLGALHYGLVGDVLFFASNRTLAEKVVRQAQGQAPILFAGSTNFQAAEKARPTGSSLWIYADLAGLAKAAGKARLMPERHENILAALLAAGLTEAAAASPYVGFEGTVKPDGLDLAFQLPTGPGRLPADYGAFFPAAAPPAKLCPARTLASIDLRRDLGGVWAVREKIVRNEELAGLGALDDAFSTYLFGGKDFGQEILPTLSPDIRLVFVRPDFAADKNAPKIKLPAGALLLSTRKPEQADAFSRAFKRLLSAVNIFFGQAKSDFDLEVDTYRDVKIWYLKFDESSGGAAGSLMANFSPAAVTLGDRFALTSSRALARELVDLHKDGRGASAAAGGDLFAIDGAEVARMLEDNRENLIAAGIAGKGQTREKAAAEIGLLISLTEMVKSLRLTTGSGDAGVRLGLELKFRGEK